MALTPLQRRVLTVWIREKVNESAGSSSGGNQVNEIRAAIMMDEAELISQIEAYKVVLRQRILDSIDQISSALENQQTQLADLE